MELEYLWGQLANVDQILYEASLGWGKDYIRFWGRFDQNPGFHGNRKRPLTYNGENDFSPLSRLFLIRFFLYLQVTKTCIRSRMSWNFGQLTMELAAIWKISHRLIMGKWCLQASSFILYRIFVKLTGNQDRHKISDEFEFQSDRISHFWVTCPCGRKNFSIGILWNLQVQLTFQTLDFFVTLFLGTVRPRVWNLVLTWAVGGCNMYTWIRLLLLIQPFISSFFFLSSFQHWNFSSLFSRELRPRRLKFGTHVDSGQMYHEYQLLIHPFISSFYFLSNFQHCSFSSHFSQKLWGLEDWNLIHT